MELINVIIYLSIYLGLIATSFYVLSFWADKKKIKLMFSDDELPRVSILIPVYNEEDSLAGTVESALKQDYPKSLFEIIIIDDGSKDKTLEIAKRFQTNKNPVVKVFHKENGGKGSALNFGIDKAKGEIIFTMDADTFAEPQSMKNMVLFFKNPEVMSVTPAMVVNRPRTILQRIQHVEYLMGLFLRKAFSSLNAIFITPGAFSAYRKSFFDKYGKYDVGNITEDLEIALRIQYNGYRIENCPEAPVSTIVPGKFKTVLIQRRRWYFGLIRNTIKYKKMLGRKYGDLGIFVMPVAWLSIFFAVFVTCYMFVKSLIEAKRNILLLQTVNFNFSGLLDLNFYWLERSLFLFFTNPILLFILLFMIVMGFYLHYASKKVKSTQALIVNLPLFFLFFAILFGFWWIVSIFYSIFAKGVKWR